ncbi:hypothetical protein [Variovorax sp. DAIF25]|uniref:hypothetical protein n=1 Tax=Variovorax sp. DAIF25 TaxID=3080983 RepID=UPI003D6AE8B8
MPEPRGRRHPLFRRLTKPIEPIYTAAATPVAWNEDFPFLLTEGVVYLVCRPCPELIRWARQIRKLHSADTSAETNPDFSWLSAAPVAPRNLVKVGEVTVRIYGEDFLREVQNRSGHHLNWQWTLLTVVLDRARGNAVGFVSFSLEWVLDALLGCEEVAELEVKLDQAWIVAEYRGRGWGDLAAGAIADTVRQSVEQLDSSARWPKGYVAKLRIVVSADLYSTSGERFLEKCATYVAMQFDLLHASERIEITEVICDGRW